MPVDRLMRSFRARTAEWLIAAVTFMSGLYFIAPYNSFQSPVFAGLKSQLPENMWAIIFLTIGASRTLILALNGRYKINYLLRAVAAMVSSGLWIQVTFGLFHSYPHSWFLAFAPIALYFEFWVVVWAAQDAHHRRVAEATRTVRVRTGFEVMLNHLKASTGLARNQGEQGDKGNQGIQGIQGFQGEQGIRGFQGVQGVQGPPGSNAVSTPTQGD